MGIHRENGYSANVEGFFVFEGEQIRLAKTNGATLAFVHPCQLPAGATGELLVIVDGQRDSKLVTLPEGTVNGSTSVAYRIAAPF